MIHYAIPFTVQSPWFAAYGVIRIPECVIVGKTSGPFTPAVRMNFTGAELQSCRQGFVLVVSGKYL